MGLLSSAVKSMLAKYKGVGKAKKKPVSKVKKRLASNETRAYRMERDDVLDSVEDRGSLGGDADYVKMVQRRHNADRVKANRKMVAGKTKSKRKVDVNMYQDYDYKEVTKVMKSYLKKKSPLTDKLIKRRIGILKTMDRRLSKLYVKYGYQNPPEKMLRLENQLRRERNKLEGLYNKKKKGSGKVHTEYEGSQKGLEG